MRAGAQVIYQATFFDGQWRGHADFLHRVEEPSDLGRVELRGRGHQARAQGQGRRAAPDVRLQRPAGAGPGRRAALDGGRPRRQRPGDRTVPGRRLHGLLPPGPGAVRGAHGRAATWRIPVTATYPEPVEHCDVCRWAVLCGPQRRRDDHLSLVAGISTPAAAAARGPSAWTRSRRSVSCPSPCEPPLDGISDQALERVREQARLQVEGRRAGQGAVRAAGAHRGRARAGAPAAAVARGPVLRHRGRPVRRGGRLGRAGVPVRGHRPTALPDFHAFWGTDRAGEKRAFERLRRLRDGPLGARTRTCTSTTTARTSRAASRQLMGLPRDARGRGRPAAAGRRLRGPVPGRPAGRPRVAGELLHQEAGAPVRPHPRGRAAGRRVEHRQLRAVAGRRPDQPAAAGPHRGLQPGRLRLQPGSSATGWRHGATDVVARRHGGAAARRPRSGRPRSTCRRTQAAVEALVERLTADLPPAEERTPEQQATWLLAQLLDWHRREDKSIWWRYFAMLAMTDEELLADREPIGGRDLRGHRGPGQAVVRPSIPIPATGERGPRGRRRSMDPVTGQNAGQRVVPSTRSRARWTSSAASGAMPHPPTGAHPPRVHRHGRPEGRAAAPRHLGRGPRHRRRWARGAPPVTCCCAGRRGPGRQPGRPLLGDGEPELDAAERLGAARSTTRVLAIQGPPGCGQDLHRRADDRWRSSGTASASGVTANSHKVIGNLLDAVVKAARRGRPDRAHRPEAGPGGRRPPARTPPPTHRADLAAALGDGRDRCRRRHGVGLGEPGRWRARWMCCSSTRPGRSRSPTRSRQLGRRASRSCSSGDPQQLEQPLQGAHPPGADASALQHLLGSAPDHPGDLGLFLERHVAAPSGHLPLHVGDVLRRPTGVRSRPPGRAGARRATDALSGTGLRWVPGRRTSGNVNESAEEATRSSASAHGAARAARG